MPVAGSTPPAGSDGTGEGLDLRASVTLAHELLRLVDRDRDEPGTESLGLSHRTELAPGDGPGRLHGVGRDGVVMADRDADAMHLRLVGRDDATEGDLVAGDRGRHDLDEVGVSGRGHGLHSR